MVVGLVGSFSVRLRCEMTFPFECGASDQGRARLAIEGGMTFRRGAFLGHRPSTSLNTTLSIPSKNLSLFDAKSRFYPGRRRWTGDRCRSAVESCALSLNALVTLHRAPRVPEKKLRPGTTTRKAWSSFGLFRPPRGRDSLLAGRLTVHHARWTSGAMSKGAQAEERFRWKRSIILDVEVFS